MTLHPIHDSRPILLAVAGPNGAGKTTFYEVFLRSAGLRYVNADDIGRELGVEAYRAAEIARAFRTELVQRRESFVFETVFSDPVGEKVQFLQEAAESGYGVVLCFIGISSAETSEERVAMRVSQGGHDVPTEKLMSRFLRTLANLGRAIEELPLVLIYDNDDLSRPYRKVAEVEAGRLAFVSDEVPPWLESVLNEPRRKARLPQFR